MHTLRFEVTACHEDGGCVARWDDPYGGGITTQGDTFADAHVVVQSGQAKPAAVVREVGGMHQGELGRDRGLFAKRYTQGPIEAVNGIIQLAKRRARGFRNLNYLRAIAYWIAGKFDLNTKSLLST